jgi:hypothetical protein
MALGSLISNTSPTFAARCSDAGGISVGEIVTMDTTDSTNSRKVVKAATASTDMPIGVVIEPASGTDKNCTVQYQGIVSVKVDGNAGNIAENQYIVAGSGYGLVAPTADATKRYALGIALAPSTAQGDYIDVMIDRTLWGEPDQA